MKKLLLNVIMLLLIHPLFAQKYEFSAQANSGLFNFSDIYDVTEAYFIANYPNTPAYNRVYTAMGNDATASYGIGVQFQRVSKINLIIGVQAGYQDMRSKLNLYTEPITGGPATSPHLTGYDIHHNQVITIAPYIGYRLLTTRATLDVAAGMFTSIGVHQQDVAYTDITDGYITITNQQSKGHNDSGIRLDLKAAYARFGIFTGYDIGERNYWEGALANNESYSRMFRFGISYRIH